MAIAFLAAVRSYFGPRTQFDTKEQERADFIKEYRALTEQDKLDIARMLREVGVDCEDPKAPSASASA